MKRKSQSTRNNAFTMIEVVVVIAMVGIITLGAGVLLANGQKSWGQLFGRVYGDSAIDSFAAQQAFDAVCRKASLRKHDLNEGGDSLELYYWDTSSTSSTPENYARFYQSGDDMFVEYGTTETGTWQPDDGASVTTIKLASDVDSLKFTVQGTSVQMFLSYIGADMMPMVCSSVRHND
ncbi:MAG: type II secretion system protein [Planctomycetota bacterium]|jgi:prepilin-type N-terminal cleavage/methylation domain-containing protein